MENKLLSRDNWQQAVRDAVEELPEDIQASVGYSEPTKWVFTLNVACEPYDVRDGETSTADVVVTWWDSYRELYLEKIQEHPGIGLEEFLEDAERRGMANWAVVTIEAEGGWEPTFQLGAGRVSLAFLKEQTQLAILTALWGAGGVSMVYKDKRGRFVRKDGSRILDWQWED